MLKAELEKENKELRRKYDTLIEKIHTATKNISDNTCEDSIQHIEDFYRMIEIPIPQKKIKIMVELPFYAGYEDLYVIDTNGDDITITSLNAI